MKRKITLRPGEQRINTLAVDMGSVKEHIVSVLVFEPSTMNISCPPTAPEIIALQDSSQNNGKYKQFSQVYIPSNRTSESKEPHQSQILFHLPGSYNH